MVSFRSHLARRLISARRRPSRKGLPVSVLGFCTLQILFGQAMGASSADIGSTDANVLNAWLAKQTDVRTWSANIVQTRSLKTLIQPLIARGRVWYEAPVQFRWELGDPPQTIAVRQPEQMLIIYPKLKRVEKFPLSGSQVGQWGGALSLLEAGFPRDRADLESKFRVVSQVQTNSVLTVRLEPKATSARRMIPRIDLILSTRDVLLQGTELEFPDGSRLRNDFQDVQLNPKLDPNLFKPEIPSDYKIIEPLKK